jgi:FkbH-like protein
MKLIEALEILKRPVADNVPGFKAFLACGFTPLHLQTFLGAQLRTAFPQHNVGIKTGLFGDLSGNIERLDFSDINTLVVVAEWSDLDPRLAVRTLGGWRPESLPDITESASQTALRLQRGITEASRHLPTIVSMPTLPLPAMFSTRTTQAGSFELQLRQTVASLAVALSRQPGVRVLNAQLLEEISPTAGRYDVKSDVVSGFPYTITHTSAMAELISGLAQNRQPKKGLITDLDDTLWNGILGEDGVDGISWHLDRKTHMHGLYQQFLASLAGAGVLVGVASKNDPAAVERAFERNDLLLSKSDVFPVEAHWSRKSESVERILKTWNIGAESVVFIDDSPMEVAEVQSAFPDMECIVFPKSDYQGVWNLLKHLRDAFGKSSLTEDDTIRLRSIRDASAWRDAEQSNGNSSDDFLRAADASIVFDAASPDGDNRAFELVNKTNQFNLNGRRFTESEWRNFFSDPAAFHFTASYKDKFGPLGKIAVIMGKSHGRRLRVSSWVMSCRAFSRRIEHQCLKHLFETFGAEEIAFDYESTPRNGPLKEFFTDLMGETPVPEMTLSKDQFVAVVPPLFHRIEGTVHV